MKNERVYTKQYVERLKKKIRNYRVATEAIKRFVYESDGKLHLSPISGSPFAMIGYEDSATVALDVNQLRAEVIKRLHNIIQRKDLNI